jgi:hypothetical protein
MAHAVSNADEFTAWLPRLTKRLAQNAVLIALDNVESLLSFPPALPTRRT